MAVSGVLGAAEWEVHFGADRARVDVGDTGVEVAHRAEGLVDVAREDRRRQAVLDAVRDADRLVEVTNANQRRGRPEDLLLRDPHPGLDVAEDSRAIVEPLVEAVPRGDLAAGQQSRALALADLRVGVDLLERAAVDDGADVRAVFPARAE